MPPTVTDAVSSAPRLSLPAVGRELQQQPVLDDDREPEGDEQRHQQVGAERAVEHQPLQPPAEREHEGQGDQQRHPDRHEQRRREREDEVGGEHDEVAMREVDEPHDAEDQRKAGGVERVESAEQGALDDGVDEGHRAAPRNTPRWIASCVSSPGRPVRLTLALHEAVDPVRRLERGGQILLDDQHRGAAPLDLGERGVDVLDHRRRQAERKLVAEQDARIGHQRAADRDHLLLAAAAASAPSWLRRSRRIGKRS